MGTDITALAERREGEPCRYVALEGVSLFNWRSYNIFAFLAGVRNYGAITPIAAPRGLPADVSEEARERLCAGVYYESWLTIAELDGFDYDQIIEDRRTDGIDEHGGRSGSLTCDAGQGERMTLRHYLGDDFFAEIAFAKDQGADRIVFAFDS